MDEFNVNAAGDLLAMRIERICSIKSVKSIGDLVGYDDSPFFGAEKKKVKLVCEVIYANVALIIFAVNQVFDNQQAKLIIDKFLLVADKSMFRAILTKNQRFNQESERRIADYAPLLKENKAGSALSKSFMENLGIRPAKNAQALTMLDAHFEKSLTETVDVLKAMKRNASGVSEKFVALKRTLAAGSGAKSRSVAAAQAEVDKTTQMLRTLIDGSVNGIVRLRWTSATPDARRYLKCMFANKAAATFLEESADQLTRKRSAEILRLAGSGMSEPSIDDVIRRFDTAVRQGETLDVELEQSGQDGIRWLRMISEAVGKDVAITFVDITQHKVREQPVVIDRSRTGKYDPTDKYENLFKLKKLLDDGIISRDEYDIERKKLMDAGD